MTSPYVFLNFEISVLRGEEKTWETGCVLLRQKVTLEIEGNEEDFTFSYAVDGTDYNRRGMFDDFFPRYPYKTTRNTWKHFRVWITSGTGAIFHDLCLEWVDLVENCLRGCSFCHRRSQKPKPAEVREIFGPYRPYFIGERPTFMYRDDDYEMDENEEQPDVLGGFVMDEVGVGVKQEVDALPRMLSVFVNITYEVGNSSKEVLVGESATTRSVDC